jgi:hypothetical protein
MFDAPTTITPSVDDVIKSWPDAAQKYALALRGLILGTANADKRIGPLTETLKWNEPAYLTEQSKSGSTLRYGWKAKHPGKMGVFVNCKTTLIAEFQNSFSGELAFEGNRAIWLDLNAPMPKDILAICNGKTLTYHLDKR